MFFRQLQNTEPLWRLTVTLLRKGCWVSRIPSYPQGNTEFCGLILGHCNLHWHILCLPRYVSNGTSKESTTDQTEQVPGASCDTFQQKVDQQTCCRPSRPMLPRPTDRFWGLNWEGFFSISDPVPMFCNVHDRFEFDILQISVALGDGIGRKLLTVSWKELFEKCEKKHFITLLENIIYWAIHLYK